MINWGRVSELRDEIGAEDFGEVVEIFLEEVDQAITELRGNGAAGDLETKLHFLKGSALNLGFADFSTRCQTGETAARNGHSDEIDLPGIIQCYEASKVDFLAALGKQSVA